MSAALPPIVVMGVSAVGKTSVGVELARLTGGVFRDADDLHSAANVARMRAGIALDDDARRPWLEAVGAALAPGTVMACSALARRYRDALRRHAPGAVFVHLEAGVDLLAARARERTGHFMPPALLQSQLDALEPLAVDEAGVAVRVDAAPREIAMRAVDALGTSSRWR
ncbi:gluconokinase [Microbacterium sp. NPDC057659]|uniref:gluconokinase n=1 Tax=Microbacterium sp. NPDC057659 TaxID=3346198 RepID=UPI003671D2D8